MPQRESEIEAEVGVRELREHLSKYVEHARKGGEVVVTKRGRRVALLVPAEVQDPLADLRARGLIGEPTATRLPRRRDLLRATGSVSDLVEDQRR